MSRLSCRRLLRGEALNERERDNRPGWAPLFQYRHRQWRAAVVGSFVLRLHLFCPPSSFTYPLSIVGMACLRIAGHLPLAKKRAAAQLNKHWHTSVTTVDDAGNRRCSSAKKWLLQFFACEREPIDGFPHCPCIAYASNAPIPHFLLAQTSHVCILRI